MSSEALKRAVMDALSSVVHPHTGDDVVASGHVQKLDVEEGGRVRFSFLLKTEDPGALIKHARSAAEGVEGVTEVKVNVQLPQAGGSGGATPGSGGGLKPGSVPAPTPRPGLLTEVDHVVAVSSGKGGVGKSMVATNLAAALAAEGLRVGLLDADIYGPNIPRMFGETRRPRVTGGKGKEMIEPLEAHGVRLMSLGFLLEDEQPAIMRGPLISGILKQFLEQVDWGPLDLMVVDMPPGTGDAQLSLVQTIDLDGAIMVSTSQAVATGDVRRGVKMFEKVNTPVMGVVENMSGYICGECGVEVDIFGSGGAERLAREMGLDFLGRIPLDPAVRKAGDAGRPTVTSAPDSPAGQALREMAQKVFTALRADGAKVPA
ncbi:MAG: iron-sulfur cluster carrier protein ApbC [Gemmatimonadales bacterium]|nr:MAG: iron-sulfur cluster carrier protein ApbC [Gemmatimonadales bacterium]